RLNRDIRAKPQGAARLSVRRTGCDEILPAFHPVGNVVNFRGLAGIAGCRRMRGAKMLNRNLLIAVLALLPAALAGRSPPAAAQEDETAVKAVKKPELKPGEIDREKSRVYVRVGKKGLGHEHGVEGKIKSGTIDLSAAKNTGEIEFDTASFLADSD